MKQLIYLFFLTSILLVFSCKKSGSDSSGNFQPVTTGSKWTYTDSNLTTALASTYTITVSGVDTTINARVYKIFNSTNGINQYFNVSGSDYYQYRGLGFAGANIEFLYLKDNYTTGQTWTTSSSLNVTVPGVPIPVAVNVSILYKIEEKLATYSVNGVTYNDVVRVSSVPTFSSVLPITTTSNINYYYARGIGMIYSKFQLNVSATGFGQAVDNETRLKSYTIM